jgi:hypothetical protein
MDDDRFGQMTLFESLLDLEQYAFIIANGHPA